MPQIIDERGQLAPQDLDERTAILTAAQPSTQTMEVAVLGQNKFINLPVSDELEQDLQSRLPGMMEDRFGELRAGYQTALAALMPEALNLERVMLQDAAQEEGLYLERLKMEREANRENAALAGQTETFAGGVLAVALSGLDAYGRRQAWRQHLEGRDAVLAPIKERQKARLAYYSDNSNILREKIARIGRAQEELELFVQDPENRDKALSRTLTDSALYEQLKPRVEEAQSVARKYLRGKYDDPYIQQAIENTLIKEYNYDPDELERGLSSKGAIDAQKELAESVNTRYRAADGLAALARHVKKMTEAGFDITGGVMRSVYDNNVIGQGRQLLGSTFDGPDEELRMANEYRRLVLQVVLPSLKKVMGQKPTDKDLTEFINSFDGAPNVSNAEMIKRLNNRFREEVQWIGSQAPGLAKWAEIMINIQTNPQLFKDREDPGQAEEQRIVYRPEESAPRGAPPTGSTPAPAVEPDPLMRRDLAQLNTEEGRTLRGQLERYRRKSVEEQAFNMADASIDLQNTPSEIAEQVLQEKAEIAASVPPAAIEELGSQEELSLGDVVEIMSATSLEDDLKYGGGFPNTMVGALGTMYTAKSSEQAAELLAANSPFYIYEGGNLVKNMITGNTQRVGGWDFQWQHMALDVAGTLGIAVLGALALKGTAVGAGAVSLWRLLSLGGARNSIRSIAAASGLVEGAVGTGKGIGRGLAGGTPYDPIMDTAVDVGTGYVGGAGLTVGLRFAGRYIGGPLRDWLAPIIEEQFPTFASGSRQAVQNFPPLMTAINLAQESIKDVTQAVARITNNRNKISASNLEILKEEGADVLDKVWSGIAGSPGRQAVQAVKSFDAAERAFRLQVDRIKPGLEGQAKINVGVRALYDDTFFSTYVLNPNIQKGKPIELDRAATKEYLAIWQRTTPGRGTIFNKQLEITKLENLAKRRGDAAHAIQSIASDQGVPGKPGFATTATVAGTDLGEMGVFNSFKDSPTSFTSALSTFSTNLKQALDEGAIKPNPGYLQAVQNIQGGLSSGTQIRLLDLYRLQGTLDAVERSITPAAGGTSSRTFAGLGTLKQQAQDLRESVGEYMFTGNGFRWGETRGTLENIVRDLPDGATTLSAADQRHFLVAMKNYNQVQRPLHQILKQTKSGTGLAKSLGYQRGGGGKELQDIEVIDFLTDASIELYEQGMKEEIPQMFLLLARDLAYKRSPARATGLPRPSTPEELSRNLVSLASFNALRRVSLSAKKGFNQADTMAQIVDDGIFDDIIPKMGMNLGGKSVALEDAPLYFIAQDLNKIRRAASADEGLLKKLGENAGQQGMGQYLARVFAALGLQAGHVTTAAGSPAVGILDTLRSALSGGVGFQAMVARAAAVDSKLAPRLSKETIEKYARISAPEFMIPGIVSILEATPDFLSKRPQPSIADIEAIDKSEGEAIDSYVEAYLKGYLTVQGQAIDLIEEQLEVESKYLDEQSKQQAKVDEAAVDAEEVIEEAEARTQEQVEIPNSMIR